MTADAWPLIHAERQALVADLTPLTEEQWTTPSLCANWTVREALAHLTAAAMMTPPRFFGHFISAGFRFNTMTANDVAVEVGSSSADTLARFRAAQSRTTHPPGPIDAMVGEAVVHGEDIRRPLSITHRYSDEILIRCADFYRKSNLIVGAKRRAAGLTLRATDVDWKAGSGPEVSGPLTSIILAITGRRAGLADLSGDGLPALTERV